MPVRLRRSCRAALPALLALVVGCGPFGYLRKVAVDASAAVAAAKAAGAEQYAPYEYWAAVSYLEQSKVLMGYSEYERSFDYGSRAKQLAEEAKIKAEMRESGKLTQSLEAPPAAPSPPAVAPPEPEPAQSEGPGDAELPTPEAGGAAVPEGEP